MEPDKQALQLAMAVHALQRLQAQRAEVMADFKAKAEGLQNEISQLAHDIEFGQEQLPLDGAQIAEVGAKLQKINGKAGESHA